MDFWLSPAREVDGLSHSHHENALQFTPCGVYLHLELRAEILNVTYRMDSAIAPDRHYAAAELVDLPTVRTVGFVMIL